MISVGFKTDKGNARTDNEDSVFVLPSLNLYMVADGVGGHNAGEMASRLAVSIMAEYTLNNPIDEVPDANSLRYYFQRLFTEANSRIFGKSVFDSGSRGMATTALLCYIKEGRAFVVNVGDSRAYLVRDAVIRQITVDHTVIRELLDSGSITQADVEGHPDQHIITRALGGESTVCPDFFTFAVYPGDTLLLCTDGLYGDVKEERIAAMAAASVSMRSLAQDLVDEANSNGGNDNISVVCIRIQ